MFRYHFKCQVSLSVCCTATDKGSRARGEPRIDHVDVKRNGIAARRGGSDLDGIFYTSKHAPTVYVAHCEEVIAQAELVHLTLFILVQVSCTDMCAVSWIQLGG